MNSTQTLNNLIEICKDGQEGFRDAAEHASNPTLKSLLSKYSLQRSTFAGELQEFVIDQGEEPEKNSSVASAVHRGWINLKSAITNGGDHAILEECERGEDHAVEAYENALEEEIPEHIREVIATQSAAVLEAHNDIRDRRDLSLA